MSGKSKSPNYPNGVRRLKQGKKLAPRSLRKKGILYLESCTKEQCKNVQIKKD